MNSNCATTSCSSTSFTWEFVSQSRHPTQMVVCRSTWAARTLSCNTLTVTSSSEQFTSTSSILISAAANNFELFALTIDFDFTDSTSLQTVSTATACHTVCFTCFGPAYNACSEFIPVIELDEEFSDSSTTSLSVREGSRQFQGRTFRSVTKLAITAWVHITSSSGWCELIRLWSNK